MFDHESEYDQLLSLQASWDMSERNIFSLLWMQVKRMYNFYANIFMFCHRKCVTEKANAITHSLHTMQADTTHYDYWGKLIQQNTKIDRNKHTSLSVNWLLHSVVSHLRSKENLLYRIIVCIIIIQTQYLSSYCVSYSKTVIAMKFIIVHNKESIDICYK